MVYTLSYRMYKCEHGLSAAEQRVADGRAGEAAAALRDLRLRLGRLPPGASRAGRPRGSGRGDGKLAEARSQHT
jgi:hypothetical protein